MDYKKIKSYEAACKALGLKPISDEVFNAFQKEDRKTMAAYHKLAVITRAINEGWQPDWSNSEYVCRFSPLLPRLQTRHVCR